MNHIHIGTTDLKKSVDFYQTFFNFKKKFDHGDGVFLENENAFLLAIDPVESVPELPSWFHLGFCLNNEAEVLELYKKIKSSEVQIVRDLLAKKDEYCSLYICDPDGYKIEISWHNE